MIGLQRLGRITKISKGDQLQQSNKRKTGISRAVRVVRPEFIAPSFPRAPYQEVTPQLLSFAFHCFSNLRATSNLFISTTTQDYSCSPSRLLNHLINKVSYTNTSSHIHLGTIKVCSVWFIFLAISVLFLLIIQSSCRTLPYLSFTPAHLVCYISKS